MKAGLTAERVRELLAYDAVTGELRWRVSRSKGKCGEPAGRIDVHEQAAAAHAKAKALHHGIGTCSAPAVPKSEAA